MIQAFLKRHVFLVLLCLLFFAAGLLRLNGISLLTPDSALYVIWGNSLAHGQSFVDPTTPEPDYFVSRGPFYSLVLAPVMFFFPGSLVAAKVWTLGIAIAALILFHRWIAKAFGPISAGCLTLVLASNPVLLVYSTEALSESLFLLLMLLVLMHASNLFESPTPPQKDFVIVVCALPALILTREVGVGMLLAALMVFALGGHHRRAAFFALVTATVVGLWYARNLLLVDKSPFSQTGNLKWFFESVSGGGSESLTREFLSRMITNLSVYGSRIAGMIIYPLFDTSQLHPLLGEIPRWFRGIESAFGTLRYFVMMIAGSMIGFGLYNDVTSGRSGIYRVVFGVLYVGIVLLFPFNDIRYMLPLLPLLLWYLARSSHALFSGPLAGRRWIVVSSIILILSPNLAGSMLIVTENISSQVTSPQPWGMLGRWIKNNTAADVLIASPVKDLALLVGDRKVLELDPATPLPAFERLLRDYAVDFIVAPSLRVGMRVYESQIAEGRRFQFTPLTSNGVLHVYKVESFLQSGKASRSLTIDTSTMTGLFLRGRVELAGENYPAAIRTFSKAIGLAGEHDELLYQLIVATTLNGDLKTAEEAYIRLSSRSSEVGIYVERARQLMRLARDLSRATSAPSLEARALNSVSIAREYWNLGYPRRAAAVLNTFLQSDSTFFTGLLWGFHYNLQIGMYDAARRHLSVLQRLDSSNQVVRSFSSIMEATDSLRREVVPGTVSGLYLERARAYHSVDLREEALDDAERALGADESNIAALLFLAERFEQAGFTRAREKISGRIRSRDPHVLLAR